MPERFDVPEIQFAEESGDGWAFKMRAYSGAPVDREWGRRMVVDLEGLEVAAKIPVLMNHDPDLIVGYTTSSDKGTDGLRLAGVVSQVTTCGSQVRALAREGYPWTASIGFSILGKEEVAEGAEVAVNGRTFAGPLTVARRTHLAEVSIVSAFPADKDTEVSVMSEMAPAPVSAPIPPAPSPTPIPSGAEAGTGAISRKEYAAELAAYLSAFPPPHRDYALSQFCAGASLLEAKAALADRLMSAPAASLSAPPPASPSAPAPTSLPAVPFLPAEARAAEAHLGDGSVPDQDALHRYDRAVVMGQIRVEQMRRAASLLRK